MKLLHPMTMIGTMMSILSPLAGGATTEESGVTPAQWLQAQPKPQFKEGHTLPPLTRYCWALPLRHNLLPEILRRKHVFDNARKCFRINEDEIFKQAVALNFVYYNFVLRHATLRMTPAMAAEITNDFWTVADPTEAP